MCRSREMREDATTTSVPGSLGRKKARRTAHGVCLLLWAHRPMNRCQSEAPILKGILVFASVLCVSCTHYASGPKDTAGPKDAAAPATSGGDSEVTTRGHIEVTAKLVEIPEGAIFKRELYNYATILKYEVLAVHRGKVDAKTIYVGHYNPFKPRGEAADQQVGGIGGNLEEVPRRAGAAAGLGSANRRLLHGRDR